MQAPAPARPVPLSATALTLDASPLSILRSVRGSIVDARIAYPEVLQVEIKDSAGELWQLATQDAEWSPSDPVTLVGRSVEDAAIDAETGELRCKLSDGSVLDVKPRRARGRRRSAQMGVDYSRRRRLGVRAGGPLADRQRRQPCFMELTARIHAEDGGYWADVPELPGCFASGDTLDELFESLQEGVALCLADEGLTAGQYRHELADARWTGSRFG